MIGSAPVFQQAVQQATQVARSDVTVLLSGESGTGKELLAAHIHRESPFAAGPFVKVNCAAIPTELIESELFGHEKGAFTGAAALRRGKFELADGGTIFLDEVGDLHEASQAKLLRVLQDGELQRVGGEQTIRVTARVISATNRRLDELVAEGRFREDLFYRLSVVPIRVPALRERLQDIRRAGAVFPVRVLRPEQLPAAHDRRRTPSRCSSATPGPATSASCETSSSGWRSSPRANGSPPTPIPLEITASHAPSRGDGASGRARFSRARADPAGTGPDRLERVGGGADARDRTDGAPQADSCARPQAHLATSGHRRFLDEPSRSALYTTPAIAAPITGASQNSQSC